MRMTGSAMQMRQRRLGMTVKALHIDFCTLGSLFIPGSLDASAGPTTLSHLGLALQQCMVSISLVQHKSQ